MAVNPWLVLKVGTWWAKNKPLRKLGLRKREENDMNKQVRSAVRSLLKVAGTYLVAATPLTASELDVLVGAVGIVAGLAWSWWEKRD